LDGYEKSKYVFLIEWDSLMMGYFDNLNNEPLNKYKINFKNKKKIIDVFFYLQIDDHLNFIQFHYHFIVHQGLLN
jgi:hypothetical protein